MLQEPLSRSMAAAIRAVVYVGTLRLEYRRAGAGPAVLLLTAESMAADLPPAWLIALAARFRVVAPELEGIEAAPGPPAADRVRGFLDGLGLERVHVVTHAATAAEVIRLALVEPDRIASIVILLAGATAAAVADPLATDRFAASGQRLLVVRAQCGDGVQSHAVERVLRFLAEG